MVKPKRVSRKKFAEFAGVRWNAMNSICALSDIKNLTPIQRVAHLAYWYMSEVYNGGHYQYFVNKCNYDHEEVIRTLVAIGAKQAAVLTAAFESVTANPLGKPQTVEQFLAGEAAADLSEFDAAYFKCDRTIESCLADYLDKHEEEFIEWIP